MPGESDYQQKARVRRQLQDAFQEVPFPFYEGDEGHPLIQRLYQIFGDPAPVNNERPSSNPIDDAEWYTWYSEFLLLSEDQAQFVLPRLLADILDQYPATTLDVLDGVMLLNVPSERFLSGIDSPPDDWGKQYEQHKYLLASAKQEKLRLLTSEQIHAIVEWLRFVITWEGVAFHHDVINAALNYWHSRLNEQL